METRLVTYAELAGILGIAVDSAKRLARRRRWQKQPGNDGLARVAVPVERLVRADVRADDRAAVSADVSEDVPGDDREDVRAVVRALEAHIATLKDTLAKAEARAAGLGRELDVARRDLLVVQAEAAAVPALKDTVAALKSALDRDKALVGELRAERDRLAARPWWRRLARSG